MKTLAVLPTQGPGLTLEQRQQLSAALLDAVQHRGDYLILDEAVVAEYMRPREFLVRADMTELQDIGQALQVGFLLLPELTQDNGQTVYKLYLFDVKANKVAKISRRNCDCQINQPETFPFQESLKIVFDVPEIILTAGLEQEEPALPPPPVIPNVEPKSEEPETETGPQAAADTLSVAQESPPPVIPSKPGLKWKPYAAGAVLVGGGILYILSRGKPGNGNQGGRLPDPPGTPDSK